jgi:hypothetical protein
MYIRNVETTPTRDQIAETESYLKQMENHPIAFQVYRALADYAKEAGRDSEELQFLLKARKKAKHQKDKDAIGLRGLELSTSLNKPDGDLFYYDISPCPQREVAEVKYCLATNSKKMSKQVWEDFVEKYPDKVAEYQDLHKELISKKIIKK